MRMAIALAVFIVFTGCGSSVATEIYWTPAHDLAPQGMCSTLAAADLDADSDCDVSMLWVSPVHHYWNVGTPQTPVWSLDTSQFSNVPYCSHRAGTFGDLDQDGDLDLVISCYDDLLRCYWNVGSSEEPVWKLDPAVFEEISILVGGAQPDLGDLDSDGDLDLVVAWALGVVQHIQNIGTSATPEWTHMGLIEGIQVGPGGNPMIALGDIDGDADLDIVGITEDSPAQCWENVGTPLVFEFTENPSMLTGIDFPIWGVGIELLDIDADGDLDLMIASWPDNYLYLNEPFVPVEPTTWGRIKAMFR